MWKGQHFERRLEGLPFFCDAVIGSFRIWISAEITKILEIIHITPQKKR